MRMAISKRNRMAGGLRWIRILQNHGLKWLSEDHSDVCRAGYFGAWSDRNTAFQCEQSRFLKRQRLICECLKYEDKMDRERFKEGLMAYIKDPKKDIAKLMYYAKERKVVKKVQNMIGVWL